MDGTCGTDLPAALQAGRVWGHQYPGFRLGRRKRRPAQPWAEFRSACQAATLFLAFAKYIRKDQKRGLTQPEHCCRTQRGWYEPEEPSRPI
jgi:hypothetical protein